MAGKFEYVKHVLLKQASQTSFMDSYLVEDMPLEIEGRKYTWDVFVAPISDSMLLGLDFLVQHRAAVDLDTSTVRIGNTELQGTLQDDRKESKLEVSRVTIARHTVIPPNTIRRVKVKPEQKLDCQVEFLIEPTDLSDDIVMAATMVTGSGYDSVPAFILNSTDKFITLKKGCHVGFASGVGHICLSLREDKEGGKRVPQGESVVPNVLQQDSQSPNISLGGQVPLRDGGTRVSNVTLVGKSLGLQPQSDHGSSGSVGHPQGNESGQHNPIKSGVAATPSGHFEEHSGGSDMTDLKCSLPEYLRDLFVRFCEGLAPEQYSKVADLLLEYTDIFAKHDLDLGCMTKVVHHINTGDAAPVKHKLRRTPLGFEHEEKKHLGKLLDVEVIRPSMSEWASAPVLIRKKDGSVRWCIDYRTLNAKTVKDTFPLPNIDDCLDALAGTQFFSTLDLESGYYQIPLAEEDMKKTAFITREGLFEHTRMGFGLCNAPATFQRAIQMVLVGLTWEEALAYLDDINVLGKSFEDELNNLRKVFERLRQYNLKLKPRKCFLFRIQCEFLGKLITRDGVKMSPNKVGAVKKWPVPRCRKDVESFLGFANYHRQHIQGFAGISSCLYDLTGMKKTHFVWQESHQHAFETLKEKLTSAPCLAYPTPSDTFILDTDASNTAVGAELSQVQGGVEKVISYASKILNPAQRKYCTTRKELLALVTFTRQFRHYLLGRRFTVRTDHGSLVWLMRFRQADGQLARWLEELSQFDMEVIHRPGKKHCNADGLSRIPDNSVECNCYQAGASLDTLPCGGCHYCTRAQHQWERFEQDVDDVVPLAKRSATTGVIDQSKPWIQRISAVKAVGGVITPPSATDVNTSQQTAVGAAPSVLPSANAQSTDQDVSVSTWLKRYSNKELHQQQWDDNDLHPIMWWLDSGLAPAEHELYLSSAGTKALWLCKNQLVLLNNVLYYRWEHRPDRRVCLVVPRSLQDEVLQFCHDSKTAGHLGRDKTLQAVKKSFLWHNMSRDCKIYVMSCAVCSKNKKAHKHLRDRKSVV
jgi:hypothetical protein